MKASGSRIDSQISVCSAKTRVKTWYRTLTLWPQDLIWLVNRTNRMERVLRFGRMVATITVCSALVLRKARVATSGQMVQSTQACGARTRWVAMGASSGLMVATSRDHFRMESCTDMECTFGKMVVDMKATTATTKSMAKVPTHILMEASTVATGTMVCSMVLAGSSMQRTLTNARANGRVENLRTGSRMIKHQLRNEEGYYRRN